MRTGYALRPVSLYNTVHTDSFTATIIIIISLSIDLLRLVNQSREKGASSWLIAMPLTDQGLALNKEEFRDSLCLRYDLPLADLPSHCICGDNFTVGHALSSKKGGGGVVAIDMTVYGTC